jgi:hypothetical protein
MASELGGAYLHSRDGGTLARRARDVIVREREKLGVMYGTAYLDLSGYLIGAALAMMAMIALVKTP